MNRVPTAQELKDLEHLSAVHLDPWLRRINENDQCYRWWFYHVCGVYQIATAVELGVNIARTTCILATAVAEMVIGVELDPNWEWIGRTIATMPGRYKDKLKIVVGDSIAPETVAEVRRLLDGRPIELLFIDSLHTVEHATAELEAYMPLLAPAALVVMDDLNQPPELWDVFHSVPGIHVNLHHLHAMGGATWARRTEPSVGFGAVIVDREDGNAPQGL